MQKIEFTGLISSVPVTYDLLVPDDVKDGTDISYCTFDVCVRRIPRGKERKVDYYTLRVYNRKNTSRNGEVCQKYCFKGMKIFAWGELQPELIETPDGTVEMALGVRASCVEFMVKRRDVVLMDLAEFEQFPDIDEEDEIGW